jgi:predicted transcriptional regulator
VPGGLQNHHVELPIGTRCSVCNNTLALGTNTGHSVLSEQLSAWYHGVMSKNLTVRLDDELAADTEALARAEGQSLNETVKLALREAVERRQKDPAFRRRVRQIIEEDRELLERLAK